LAATSLELGRFRHYCAAADTAKSNNALSDEFLFDKLPENRACV